MGESCGKIVFIQCILIYIRVCGVYLSGHINQDLILYTNGFCNTAPTHPTHTYMQGETDEQYLRKVADVMHSLFGTHGTSVLPFFDELLPTFAGMLVSFSTTSLYSSSFVQSF